jgi:hypothetical protein
VTGPSAPPYRLSALPVRFPLKWDELTQFCRYPRVEMAVRGSGEMAVRESQLRRAAPGPDGWETVGDILRIRERSPRDFEERPLLVVVNALTPAGTTQPVKVSNFVSSPQ